LVHISQDEDGIMNRIDRYLASLFILYFLGGLAVFISLFIAVQAMTDVVSAQGVAPAVWVRYYLYSLPEIVYRMVPVACLIGTIFTVSTIHRANELVALFTMGLSLVRITLPILILIGLIGLFQLFLSDQVMPSFAKHKNFTYYHEIRKNPSLYSIVKTNRIWYRSKNLIFNIKTLNPEQKRAQGLTLYSFDDAWNLIQMMTAAEVEFKPDNWLLKKGSVTLFTEDSSFPLTSDFNEKSIVVGEDTKDLTTSANTADILSLSELAQYIKKNKEAGLDTLRYEMDFHSKFGYAAAALVMSLLGIPFSIGKTRSGGVFVGLGICLGLVFLYWIFYSSSMTLGAHGHLPPVVAAWLPNVATALLGYFLIRRLKR